MKAAAHHDIRTGRFIRGILVTTVGALVVSLLQWIAPAPAEAATLVTTVQAETLTRTGSAGASATVVTFYSNGDSAYGALTFPDAGRYTITVNGSSSASSTAGISVLVDGAKVSALSFTGTAFADASATFDVATAGSKEVRLKLETDNGQNDTRIDYFSLSYVGPTPALPAAPVPPTQGAFASGQYRDLFLERDPSLTDSDVTQKLNAYWTSFFTGTDDTKRVYYPAGSNANGSLAYILDTGNSDVRSEGMSYGMMIAVQMDKKAEFDAIWNWAKTYMQQTSGARSGYFCWQATTSGSCSDQNPASDGEEYFATALLFAGNRWGSGTGIYDYTAEGNAILNTMLHKEDMNGGIVNSVTNMFNKTSKMVVFVPYASSANFSDPSYHLPAFYELWGRWATGWNGNQAADRQFWLDAAARSRQYFAQATNATTGLAPDYAEFTGAPNGTGNHGDFRFDAWRTAVNWSVDYAWWAADPNEKALSDRLQSFFDGKGTTAYVNQYSLTGTPLSTDRSPGLIASNGAAALAATDQRAWKFVEALWNLQPPTGQYRYYDGLLNFMALLHASGNFRIYGPGSAAPDTVAPSAPTGLAQVASTSTSITLSWTAATDDRAVTGYTAYLGTSGTGATGCTAVTTTSCTITGLAPQTTYSVTVKALDAGGNASAASSELALTTPSVTASAPAAPTQLSAIANTTTGAVLTWNDNSYTESDYVIERKAGASGTWAPLITRPADTTSYTDTGLTSGTQYVYRVRAVNAVGSSATSNEATAKPVASGSSANRSAIYRIEAESFEDSSGVSVEAGDGGTVVNFASSASWIKLSGVAFGTTNVARAFFRAQKTSSGGNVVLYIDNLSTARCTVYPDGNNTWALKDNSCSPAFQGTHDVYIKPTGPIKINYLYVTPQSTGSAAPALPADAVNAIASANAVDVTLYTPSTVQTFVTAYLAVTALTSDLPSATISAAVAALAAAQSGLVLKPDLAALRAALAAADALDAAGFTPASWADLTAAVQSAWSIGTSSSQAATDSAAEAVGSAISALIPASTQSDLGALQSALTAASALRAADYTSGSWSTVLAAVAVGLGLTADSPQSAVDQAAGAIQTAILALVPAASLSSLQAALAAAAAQDASRYTEASWASVVVAVAHGASLTGDSAQQDVDAAAAAIDAALDALVPHADLSSLQAALASAALLDASDYRATTWATLAHAVQAGQALTAESSQAAVDAATAEIAHARAALVRKTDLDALTAKLAAASSLTASAYTQSTWAALADAVAAGEALTDESSQASVDDAVTAIGAAIAGLVPVADVDALHAALDAAGALSPAEYTFASWSPLADAVAAASALTSQSSQSVVDAAAAAIRAAVSALVRVADLGALQTALSSVALLDSSRYSPESWSALWEAVTTAQALDAQSPQAAVDAATAAVRSAISGLVVLADLDELQAALAAAAGLDLAAYTTSSRAPLVTAVSNGRQLTITSPQTEVDAATAAIRSAISGLVRLAQLGALQAALTVADALSRSDYTSGSWSNLTDAVAAGDALTAQSSQSDVDAAAAAIQSAIASLVPASDLEALNAALASASALTSSDFTATSWASLTSAVSTGRGLTSDASQSAVDAASDAIRAAIAALVPLSDLAELEAALEAAGTLHSADYTASSWAVLAAAVSAGQTLTRTSPQSTVTAAAGAIRSAVAALVPVSALGGLHSALGSADALTAADYTTASWSGLAAAVSAGRALTSQSPQPSVDAAEAAIRSAIAALVHVADLSALQTALASASALSASGYTPASWAVLTTAMSAGRALTAQSTQSAVDAAAAAVRAAVIGLVPVTVTLPAFTKAPRPTIVGTPRVGAALSVSTGTWAPVPQQFTFQWLVAGTLAGTGATYTPVAADLGKTITVTATASKPGYRDTTSSPSAASAKVAAGELSASVPTVSGTACVDCELTAVAGVWGPAPVTLAYQWLRDGKAIAGATAPRYSVTAGDEAKRLSVTVKGTKPGYGDLSKTSASTAKVAAGALAATTAPTISGTAQVDATLTAAVAAWAPAPVTLAYQWLVNGKKVKGATASTFTVPASASGSLVEVWVTGSKPGYESVVRASDSVLIAPAQFVTAVPVITGTLAIGSVLTASPGAWSPGDGTKFTYQWYWKASAGDAPSPISGATKAGYTIPTAMAGRLLLVKVTAERSGYATVSRTSADTALIVGVLTTRTPTIAGTAAVGKKLTAQPGAWGPSGVQFAYEWVRTTGTSSRTIAGATSSTYVLTAADKGSTIQVRVTGSLAGFTPSTVASAATVSVR